MQFRGLQDYRVRDADQLRSDLQRQNHAVASSLKELDREKANRPIFRRVTSDVTPELGEGLLLDTSDGEIIVRLPAATGEENGRTVVLCLTSDANPVTVIAVDGSVQGETFDRLSAVGYQPYAWDGVGGWWRIPAGNTPDPTQDNQMLVSQGGEWTLVDPPASTLTDTLMYDGTSIEWAGRIYVSQVVSANTVALWRMHTAVSGLLDSGPNGIDLAVFAGTARGASAWPTMGGVYFDGSVGLRAPASSLLRLTGDMTVAFVTTGFRDGTLTNSHFFAHSAFGETEATNYLYGLQYGTFPALTYIHERGAGINETTQWGSSAGQHVFASWNIPVMIHLTRASGVVNLYMQGIQISPSSGVLSAPTGGADGRLTIGCSVLGTSGTFANGYNGVITDFLIENRAWSEVEVKTNYNRCLGQIMGRRP